MAGMLIKTISGQKSEPDDNIKNTCVDRKKSITIKSLRKM